MQVYLVWEVPRNATTAQTKAVERFESDYCYSDETGNKSGAETSSLQQASTMANLTAQQRQELIEELPRLKRFCLSLTSDPADADDLLQITVERLLEKGMPEDAHVAKWSHRVCRNLWIDEIRSRDVRSRHAQSEGAVEGAGTTSAAADESVQLDRVSTAMERLPPEQRAALVQVAVEGCSYAEAAALLEVPIGTIMSRVARARKALAEDLEWGAEREA